MRIVSVSDTHTFGRRIQVPDGDLLVHAGDLTFRGTEAEVAGELDWFASLPHARKLFVAGNHDWFFDPKMPSDFQGYSLRRSRPVASLLADYPEIAYLQDSGCEIEGLKIWGSPWQPNFQSWAFNFPKTGDAIPLQTWARIPDDTQILVTHGPPNGILDAVSAERNVGDHALADRIQHLRDLRLHIFGHIHEAYGREERVLASGAKVTFVNASSCTKDYRPINPPVVVDFAEHGSIR